MTTIGVIGSGNIGATVARLAVNAGHDVVVSNSRGPASLAALVESLGPRARAATPADAAEAADLVVVAIPFGVFASVPVGPTAGKPVIDSNNYYPERDGHFAELDDGLTTSSELLQRHLPGAAVIKAFNNVFYKHLLDLARPNQPEQRCALPVAGDDPSAKASVIAFLDSIGYDAVDAGPLPEGRRFQPGTPAYRIYLGEGPDPWETGKQVDAGALTAALAAAPS